MEGHPDNVLPSLRGGLQVAVRDESGRVLACPVRLGAPVRAALFIPHEELSTSAARAVLPRDVPPADAVFNLSRAALLVAALAAGAARSARRGDERSTAGGGRGARSARRLYVSASQLRDRDPVDERLVGCVEAKIRPACAGLRSDRLSRGSRIGNRGDEGGIDREWRRPVTVADVETVLAEVAAGER